MYERDSLVAHNAPVYSRHPQAFSGRSRSGVDRPKSEQANHAIGLSHKTNGYNRRPTRRPTVSAVKVKRLIPQEWILQPPNCQPVNKQCKTGEGHHDSGSRSRTTSGGSRSRSKNHTSSESRDRDKNKSCVNRRRSEESKKAP